MNDKKPKTIAYSDIMLDNWKDYTDVITDTWWHFSSRGNSNGHKFEYHGNFIPQIPEQMLKRYTKAGDIVVDWFLGLGTTLIEALNQQRRIIGVELQEQLVEKLSSGVPPERMEEWVRILCADSSSDDALCKVKAALGEMNSGFAQFAILHPPYADIIRFSESESDLSNLPTTDDFIDGFRKVARNAYETLEPGRFAVLVIGDKYSDGELDPLGFKCMQAMNDVGFKTKSIIVKNIEGNEIAKGKSNNLWRYRALAFGFYIFKHEYVIVFFKPTENRV